MTPYDTIAIIITIAITILYINNRYFKIQQTIALMGSSFIIALLLTIASKFGFNVIHADISDFVNRLHFNDLLLNGMLGLLLFAGSLTVDMSRLKEQKIEIILLSTISVIVSTFLIGIILFYLIKFLNLNIDFIYCLLFGALISPTDPIAVLATFRKTKISGHLEHLITAESLFNDGVGVVLFIVLFNAGFNNHDNINFLKICSLFFEKAIGGLLFGLALGFISYLILKNLRHGKTAILITIAITTGGYALAEAIKVSGPLAMVAAGIFIANYKNKIFIDKKEKQQIENFWEIIDELLNAILFLLIGLELLVIDFKIIYLVLGVIMIPLLLIIRYLTVAPAIKFLDVNKKYPKRASVILTWSGLRGGLAVALALSIPGGMIGDIFVPITYIIVVFSILVQAVTIKPFLKKVS